LEVEHIVEKDPDERKCRSLGFADTAKDFFDLTSSLALMEFLEINLFET
jgi:hypothetical protein